MQVTFRQTTDEGCVDPIVCDRLVSSKLSYVIKTATGCGKYCTYHHRITLSGEHLDDVNCMGLCRNTVGFDDRYIKLSMEISNGLDVKLT